VPIRAYILVEVSLNRHGYSEQTSVELKTHLPFTSLRVFPQSNPTHAVR
jgi:hypothetical protein